MHRELLFDDVERGVWKQGFEIHPKRNQWSREHLLHVFIVPHSHNDPGWLRTVDEYFQASTKAILNLTTLKLSHNKNMSFIWAEISYLSMWWNDADEESRRRFWLLVDSGQLELVTGGWVMNDEATTHYYAMIDQMIEGHEWIRVNLNVTGVKLQAGWAIDPFGLSPTMAFVLKRMGLKQMVVQRAHYAVKKQLARARQLEFYWRQQFDYATDTDILCHLMPFNEYDIPHACGPDPAICCQFDFRRLRSLGGVPPKPCPWNVQPSVITDENVDERAALLVDQYKKEAELFRTDVLLIPLGGDFRWSTEMEWSAQTSNYQLLMNYINQRPDQFGVILQWGTLTNYFDSVEASAKLRGTEETRTFPTLTGDFFTYADRNDNYWSGYYASRPYYKRLSRVVESRLRAAELMFSWIMTRVHDGTVDSSAANDLLDSLFTHLVLARRSSALFQHHDAITGTARTAVVNDYGKRLGSALDSCDKIISASLAITFLKAYDMELKRNQTSAAALTSFDSTLYSASLVTSDERQTEQEPLLAEKYLLLGTHPRDAKEHLYRRRVVVYNSLASERIELVCSPINDEFTCTQPNRKT